MGRSVVHECTIEHGRSDDLKRLVFVHRHQTESTTLLLGLLPAHQVVELLCVGLELHDLAERQHVSVERLPTSLEIEHGASCHH